MSTQQKQTITLTDGNGRNPRNLDREEYQLLKDTGMLWELHPDAPMQWPSPEPVMTTPNTPSAEAVAVDHELARRIVSVVLRDQEAAWGTVTQIISGHLSAALAKAEAERDAWKKADNVHTQAIHEIGDALCRRQNYGYITGDVIALAKAAITREDSLLSDANKGVKEVVALRAALARGKEDGERLEAVRLAALRDVAFHIGSIPEAEIENGRLEHAFILSAHRILATGEPDGILKTDSVDSAARTQNFKPQEGT